MQICHFTGDIDQIGGWPIWPTAGYRPSPVLAEGDHGNVKMMLDNTVMPMWRIPAMPMAPLRTLYDVRGAMWPKHTGQRVR